MSSGLIFDHVVFVSCCFCLFVVLPVDLLLCFSINSVFLLSKAFAHKHKTRYNSPIGDVQNARLPWAEPEPKVQFKAHATDDTSLYYLRGRSYPGCVSAVDFLSSHSLVLFRQLKAPYVSH